MRVYIYIVDIESYTMSHPKDAFKEAGPWIPPINLKARKLSKSQPNPKHSWDSTCYREYSGNLLGVLGVRA